MSDSTQEAAKKPEFNKLQQVLWPIHNYELKKFLPISLLMFCILFVYTMVRDLKDVFIQKYAICGSTELISTLKLWFVMPAAFLVVMLFTYLINKFGGTKTFYIMVSIFIAFYTVFVLFLFPNASSIHAGAETVRKMQASWPGFFFYIIPCLTNWSYTLFYIFSEIWGTIAISSLFWQFANQITKKTEAKRFYGLYALIGNIGVFASGSLLVSMSKAKGAEFDKNVRILVGCCILFAIATMLIYYYINVVIMKDPKFYDASEVRVKKKKAKVGIMEGIKILFTSPYIGLIAVLVVAYGVSINFLEIVWKEQMRVVLTNANDYSAMMGNLSKTTAILTISATLLSTNVLRKCSWKVSAIVSPAIMLLLGGLFFLLIIYGKNGGTQFMGQSVALMAIWVGLIADAVIKSVKYCLFDSSKNLAYRPLDEDTKTKGQAAVEVIGGRAGKAGASTINYMLTNVVAVGSKISSHIYTIVPLFAVSVVGWIMAVSGLSKRYEAKLAEQAEAEKVTQEAK